MPENTDVPLPPVFGEQSAVKLVPGVPLMLPPPKSVLVLQAVVIDVVHKDAEAGVWLNAMAAKKLPAKRTVKIENDQKSRNLMDTILLPGEVRIGVG